MDNLLIGDFNGPLDLLLHLIKKSKMEIFDINICEITNQYVEYINKMKDMNLNIASEYLVMAAELIEMKSRKLLPSLNDEEDSDEEEVNSEENLKKRLIEYQKYKDSLGTFRSLEEKRSNYYTKAPENISSFSNYKMENDGTVDAHDLLNALQALLERQKYSRPQQTKIARKEISVKDRIVKIREILNNKKRINFVDLFDDFSKGYVVVTFLSILEMTKNQEVKLKQENNFEDIYIESVN